MGVEIGDAEMEGKGRKRQRVTVCGRSAIGSWGIFLRHTDNEDGDCEPITAQAGFSMADPRWAGGGERGTWREGERSGKERDGRNEGEGKLKAISDSEFISRSSIVTTDKRPSSLPTPVTACFYVKKLDVLSSLTITMLLIFISPTRLTLP